jgi:hypothetical protein
MTLWRCWPPQGPKSPAPRLPGDTVGVAEPRMAGPPPGLLEQENKTQPPLPTPGLALWAPRPLQKRGVGRSPGGAAGPGRAGAVVCAKPH